MHTKFVLSALITNLKKLDTLQFFDIITYVIYLPFGRITFKLL